jgi:polyisoprenoid-binding protein YceI
VHTWLVGSLVVLQALLPVGAFRPDPGESRVEFVMRDNRGGFTGATDRIEGAVVVSEADAGAFVATVEARIDARTLGTGIGFRDAQMRRDFLQTDRYPFIEFRGTAVSRDRPGAGSLRAVLRGALTIRGVTREIEMPIVVIAPGDEYRASGEVVVRLSEFGIPIPRFLVFVAEDAVTVKIRVRVRRA